MQIMVVFMDFLKIIFKGLYLRQKADQKGISLVEVLFVMGILATITLMTVSSLLQSQKSLNSASRGNECQAIVKNALESVASLGSRLYGYKNNHSTANLSYDPLFITKNSKSYNVDGNIKNVGSGQQLSFPPNLYQDLYKDLVAMDISTPIKTNPKSNMGFDVISDKNTYPIEIASSVLLVNFVNALQYLYNADADYSTGDGKQITGTDGLLASLLSRYKKQKKLKKTDLYIKITPVKGNGKTLSQRPIFTRPKFTANSNAIPSDLIIQGEDDVGFEVKAKVTYQYNDHTLNCEGSKRFFHQILNQSATSTEDLGITLSALSNGAGQDLTTSSLKNTSCDSHGNGYDDISVTLDFNTMTESRLAGTVLLCQMSSYCRSDGDNGSYTNSKGVVTCTPTVGRWQRCHDIQPKPSSDQAWTFKAKLALNSKSKEILKLQFDDMKDNRRYELHVAEFAIDGRKARSKKMMFYIDGSRPVLGSKEILGDEVGSPDDNKKSRNYAGPTTNWKVPGNAFKNKWIQCNQSDVDLKVTISDPFTHNLENCEITATRQDGTGTTSPASLTSTLDKDQGTCKGTLTGIQHGRQRVEFTLKDACAGGTGNKESLVWDTDLPSTFKPQPFTSANTQSLINFNISGLGKYPVSPVVPADSGFGTFPKHYSVKCTDAYNDLTTVREEGALTCELGQIDADVQDGCNPSPLGMAYFHVCGNQNCKGARWSVNASGSKAPTDACSERTVSECRLQETLTETQDTKGVAVDILFVIDASPSMDTFQNKLAPRFGDLFTELKDADWQMAFVGVEPATSLTYGKFYGSILTPSSTNLSPTFSHSIRNMRKNSGREFPILNIKSVVNNSTYQSSFFREDAGFVAIILTNEATDLSISDVKAIIRGEQNRIPSLVSSVKGLGSEKQFFTYGVIPQASSTCTCETTFSCKEYYDWGRVDHIIDLVNHSYTQGFNKDICASDYTAIIKDIGKHFIGKLSLKKIDLKQGAIESTITVTYSPTPTNTPKWHYNASKNQIIFTVAPPEDTIITVTYEYYITS